MRSYRSIVLLAAPLYRSRASLAFASLGSSGGCGGTASGGNRRIIRTTTTATNMAVSWDDAWSDILSGGDTRWKVQNPKSHQTAIGHLKEYLPENDPSKVSVFLPLAGDDPKAYLLWTLGYSVTTIDLVPAAVQAMKEQFSDNPDDDWTKEEKDDTTVFWKHASGRATLMVGDALQPRPYLTNQFDAIVDKDAFGALGKDMRKDYCQRMAEYTKPGGILYLECVLKPNHDEIKDMGPPFSLKQDDLMDDDNYGKNFEYVKDLGEVYELEDLPQEFSEMKQTGHILRKI